jgi:hypothetical protein
MTSAGKRMLTGSFDRRPLIRGCATFRSVRHGVEKRNDEQVAFT